MPGTGDSKGTAVLWGCVLKPFQNENNSALSGRGPSINSTVPGLVRAQGWEYLGFPGRDDSGVGTSSCGWTGAG